MKQSKGSFFLPPPPVGLRRWSSCYTRFHSAPSRSAIIPEPPCCDLNTEPACLHSPDPLICLYSYLFSIFHIFNFLPKYCSPPPLPPNTVAFTFYKWNKQSLFTKVSLPGLFLTAAGWFEMWLGSKVTKHHAFALTLSTNGRSKTCTLGLLFSSLLSSHALNVLLYVVK